MDHSSSGVFDQQYKQQRLRLQPGYFHSNGAQSVAITIPSEGAYLSGSPTVAHTWCPTGTAADYASETFYPQGDVVLDSSNNPLQTDVLAATTDGNHILGAALVNGAVELDDIGVTIPLGPCPEKTNPDGSQTLSALNFTHKLNQGQLTQVNAANVDHMNQVVVSPASNLAFVTYFPSTTNPATGASLPYYQVPAAGSNTFGTLGYLALTGASAITAPVAGAFSPDDSLFFLSTAGDNKVHYISLPGLKDTLQISPELPACVPPSTGGGDVGCQYTGSARWFLPRRLR